MIDIKDYLDWAVKNDIEDPASRGKSDASILTLGLVGEIGDVSINSFCFDTPCENLKSSLGNIVYYWSLLCREFELNINELVKRGELEAQINPYTEKNSLSRRLVDIHSLQSY